jgi:flagellar biosynthesis protein FliQ
MATDQQHLNEAWPERTLLLSLGGAAVGLITYFLIAYDYGANPVAVWRYALAAFFLTGGVTTAFVLERSRVQTALIFAAVAGLIIGFTVYWNGAPYAQNDWEVWRIACAAVTIAVAAPLYQAGVFRALIKGDVPRKDVLSSTPYATVHDRVWMNMILWGACWGFTGLVILLGFLIGSLFNLIGINFITDVMEKEWFFMPLMGGAFGAAAGVLREKEVILITLQKIIRTVLSILAPVFGAALVIFLVATIFGGLSSLWDATRSTTPILLATIAVALILANAVIGDSPEDEAKAKVLRWGAMALAGTILPLAVIAAISTGVRVSQYGLSPDRLWAIVFTGVAVTIGVAYFAAIARGKGGWHALARRGNITMAAGLCMLAFVLSTPLLNFSALSTANQIARLEAGVVSPEKFSWDVLRFDYGEAGRAALKKLAASSSTPEISKRAAEALKYEDNQRYEMSNADEMAARRKQIETNIIVKPAKVPLPAGLAYTMSLDQNCGSEATCVLHYIPGQLEAVLIVKSCRDCATTTRHVQAKKADWSDREDPKDGRAAAAMDAVSDEPGYNPTQDVLKAGKVEIRPVTRRQIFVDGRPVGSVLDEAK